MDRAWLSDMFKDRVSRNKAERIAKQESWNAATGSPVVVILV